jgi:hypothetical protein
MLETDLQELFELQAGSDGPPARFSVPAARRQARSRIRIRRAGTIGAPVLAACAVLAVALSATVFSGGSPGIIGPGAPAAAPKHFDPLHPYASFGWLPPGTQDRPDGLFTSTIESIALRSPAGQVIWLVLNAAGQCRVTRSALDCSKYGVGAPVGRVVGEIAGRPARWVPPRPHPLGYYEPGILTWQYARGGWAILQAPSVPVALAVAAGIRYGGPPASVIRFSFQLTGVPAGWQLSWVSTQWMRYPEGTGSYYEYAGTYDIASGPTLVANLNVLSGTNPATPVPVGWPTVMLGPYPPQLAPVVAIGTPYVLGGPFRGRGNCASADASTTTIHGQPVFIWRQKTPWPGSSACVDGPADGDAVTFWVYGGAVISPLDLLTSHIRLLGPDPADWATVPIG